jgi:hypothetical protein
LALLVIDLPEFADLGLRALDELKQLMHRIKIAERLVIL